MSTSVQMVVYVTPVRILTTGVALFGIIAHVLVTYLTKKKAKSDHSAYVLLMQIYSVSTIIRLFTGWLVIYRTQSLGGGHSLMFSYGLLGLIDPTSAGIVQSISNTFSPIITIFIPLSMSARTLLLFNRPLSKRMVMLPVSILFLAGLGLFITMLIVLSHSAVSTIPVAYLEEANVAPPFAELHYDIEASLWTVGSNSTYVCVPVTFLLRYIMVRRLKRMVTTFSGRMTKLHTSFVTLLTFEASVLFIGILVTILRALAKPEYNLFPALGTLLSAFSFPILLAQPMIQGIATLFLVPYLRREVLKPFGGSKTSVREFTTTVAF